MHTRSQAVTEPSQQQRQVAQQPTALLTQPRVVFEDNRPQTLQLKALQMMVGSSARQQMQHNVLTMIRASTDSQKLLPSQGSGAVMQRHIMPPVQRLPRFKAQRDAIYYFEDIEQDQFESRKKDIQDLLALSRDNGWDDLEERITYALSEISERGKIFSNEQELEQRWNQIDQTDPANLAHALKLLEQAQQYQLDELEDKIIRYVRRTEDERDDILSASAISPEQQRMLNKYRDESGVDYPELVYLVKVKGSSPTNLVFIDACLQQMLAIGTTKVLSVQTFDLLQPYAGLLTPDSAALHRMLMLAQQAAADVEDYMALKNVLGLFAEFNFMPDQAILCSFQAMADADTLQETLQEDVRKQAEVLIAQVKKNNLQAVVKGLNRNQKKEYDKDLNSAREKAKDKAEQNAVPEVEQIHHATQDKFRQIQIISGPQEYERKKQQYRDFCQRYHFHPACADALELTGYNIARAAGCMDTVISQPNLSALIGADGISWQIYNNILSTIGAPAAHAILANVSPVQLLAFWQHPTAMLALTSCYATIPLQHLATWANAPSTYAPICCSGAETDFAALITAYSPQQLMQLWQCKPSSVSGAAATALLNQYRTIAATAGDLLACLQLATQLNLDATRLTSIISVLAPGQTTVQFQAALYANALDQYDRDSDFNGWIACLGGLMAAPATTWSIAEGVSSQLPYGIGTNKETWERTVTVSNGGAFYSVFQIHYHPFAANAKVGSAYASRRHLKPARSSDIRIHWSSIPASIRGQISNRE